MTTLGIFGDSWTDDSFGHHSFRPEGDQWAWFHNIPNYKATSHGRGGCSLYYIYKQFLEHHTKYDKIIVILTQYERMPESFFYLKDHDMPVFLPGVDQTNNYLKIYKNNLTIHDTNKLTAVRDFYLWAQEDRICYDMGALIVDKIKQIRPNALIINGFYQGIGHPNIGENKFPEVTGPSIIAYMDAMIRGIIPNYSDVVFPHLKVGGLEELKLTCHLSKETNLVIAKDIYHALVTGVWDPIVPYVIPHENTGLNYYYGQPMW